jgi:hypothetical protein
VQQSVHRSQKNLSYNQLFQTQNFTNVSHKTQNVRKTLLNVTNQYVTYNNSRVERLVRNLRPANSLNFENGSSMTLTGDASVTIA